MRWLVKAKNYDTFETKEMTIDAPSVEDLHYQVESRGLEVVQLEILEDDEENENISEQPIVPTQAATEPLAKQTKTDIMVIVLRWIFLLPSAWFASFFVNKCALYSIEHGDFMCISGHGGWIDSLLMLPAALGAGLASVYAGASVAPNGKRVVAIVLASVFGTLFLGAAVLLIASTETDWWLCAQAVAQATGGALTAYSIAAGDVDGM